MNTIKHNKPILVNKQYPGQLSVKCNKWQSLLHFTV